MPRSTLSFRGKLVTHLFISFVFFIAALLLNDFLLKLIQGDNKFFVECAGGDA